MVFSTPFTVFSILTPGFSASLIVNFFAQAVAVLSPSLVFTTTFAVYVPGVVMSTLVEAVVAFVETALVATVLLFELTTVNVYLDIVAPFLVLAVAFSATFVRFVITGVLRASHWAEGFGTTLAVTGLPQILMIAFLNVPSELKNI